MGESAEEDDDQPVTPATTKKRPATGGAPPSAGSPSQIKRPRTNTPWTAAEEQRLKNMRDAGNSWSEIAKTFPTRTEGSVKKHWYKVTHSRRVEVLDTPILTFLLSGHALRGVW